MELDGSTSHDFNVGSIVFLPKKPAGNDPLFGDYYTAADMRPLTIVNTDNRLITNAYRLRAEPALAAWISDMQRGFLSDRSMLANVVDVEHDAQEVALTEEAGATFLFDFKAAFPSISHAFIHRILAKLGVPAEFRRMVRSLYDDQRCAIHWGGSTHAGFDIAAGVRQGCPLSPLLFVLVLDPFLRRMHRALPDATIRAFADDIAVVSRRLWRDLPILNRLYFDMARVSGMELNL